MNSKPFPRLQLVVFDLDGTLLDTFHDIRAALNYSLREMGREEIDLPTTRSYVGRGLRNLLRQSFKTEDPAILDQAQDLWKQYAMERPVDHSTIHPGAIELVETLRARGIPRVVLSNKFEPIVIRVLEEIGMMDCFDLAWGEIDKRPTKPDPTALLQLAERFDAPIEQTMLVGDGRPDMGAAKAAGAIACGMTHGQLDAETLRELGADFIYDHFDDLRGDIAEACLSAD